MTIDSSTMSNMQDAMSLQRPSKLSEPMAPVGGNVENRQPPSEPQKPSSSEGTKALGVGNALDIQG